MFQEEDYCNTDNFSDAEPINHLDDFDVIQAFEPCYDLGIAERNAIRLSELTSTQFEAKQIGDGVFQAVEVKPNYTEFNTEECSEPSANSTNSDDTRKPLTTEEIADIVQKMTVPHHDIELVGTWATTLSTLTEDSYQTQELPNGLFQAVPELLKTNTLQLVEIKPDYTDHNFFQNVPNFGEIPELQNGIDWQTELKNHVLEFNKEYAIVLNGTKTLVMKATPNEDGRLERVYLSLDAFRNLYLNELIKTGEKEHKKTGEITDVLETKANAWLRHKDCIKYKDGVIFEPSRYANGVEVKKTIYGNKLNLWQGYSVEPKQGVTGALDRIHHHIQHIICNDDPACIEYFYNWTARCFQYPEKTGQVAIALKGEKGCGKGSIANLIKVMHGQHSLQITNAKHLVGNFNGHLSDCCFLFADEAFFAGDKQHENILKTLITESTLMIERKGIDAEPMPNRLKIIMASNNDWITPASKDERRYFVLDVSSEKIGDTDYFNTLHRDINNPEIQAAFLYEMLHRDISKFNVSKIPDTKALQHQREQSLDSFGKYWYDVLQRGYIYQSQHGNDDFYNWLAEPSVELIKRGYAQWCNANKIDQHRIVSEKKIGSHLTSWFGDKKRKLNVNGVLRGETAKGELDVSRGQTCIYVIGSLIEAINSFCEFEKLDAEKLI